MYILLFFNPLLISTLQGQPKELKWTKEEILNVTIYLGDTITKASGTGTIIGSQGRFFILTANHVASNISTGGVVIFHKNSKPLSRTFMSLTDNKARWVHHKTSDISIVEIFPKDTSLNSWISKWNFPLNQVYFGKDVPSMDHLLTFLGFPVIDYKLEFFSPLLFQANISSGLITQARYDTKALTTFFFLSEPSIQGCSGSGVFLWVRPKAGVFVGGDRTVLMGIIHGTQTDNTGGKMAAVTPTFYLKDIIK